MKRALAIALMFLLTGIAVLSDSVRAPKGFAGHVWSNTLALYGTKNKTTHFVCTATPIQKIEGGYRLLSAGHCVQLTPADLQFSVADEAGGALTPVTMVKAFDGDGLDFAIFDVHTTKVYSIVAMDMKSTLRVGDQVLNPHFALGLGKQLSRGLVSSKTLVKSEDCDFADCTTNFLIQMYGGSGASGSAVYSLKTHKIIGIVIAQFHAPVGFMVEPISLFTKFLAGPNQPHPVESEEDDQ